MDVGRSITFLFTDPDWIKKTAIGGVLLVIPIIGWLIVAGYWLRVVRRVALGSDLPLPEWDDFGGDIVRGAKGFLALLIWSLPLIFMQGLFFGAFLPVVIYGDAIDTPVAALLVGVGAIVWIALFLASLIIQFAVTFVQPLILGRIAMTESLSSAFAVGDILKEARRTPVPLLIVALLEYGLTSIAGFGVLLCVIGIVFTYFIGFVMLSHLYGQVYRLVGAPSP